MLFAGILAVGMLQPAAAHQGPNKIWVRDASVVEGDTGTTTAQVKIVLKRKHHFKKVSVAYKTVDGTAVAGSDYVAQRGRVWFPKGKKFAYVNVEVPVIGDTVDEADEYFKVHLFRPYRARIVDRVGIVTIVDDDEAAPPAPVLPKLSVGDDSAEEGKAVWFKVSLSAPAPDTVTFDYATANGTAEAGKDYDAVSRDDKAIAKGEDHVWIRVTTIEDSTDEPDEYFYLNVSDVKGATVLDAQGKGTILDDDPAPAPVLPKLSISDDSVEEGKAAWFKVSLSAPAPGTVTFDYATADGTAEAGKDYDKATGDNKVIAKGETHVWIKVMTREDDFDEPHEVFYVNISDVKGATVLDGQGKGIILDDDPTPALPKLVVRDLSVDEGNVANFQIWLSAPAPQAITLDYTTVDADAKASTDYVAKSGSVTIPKGATGTTIAIETKEDALDEPDEDFLLRVSDVKGATVLKAQGRAVIVDDDPAPSMSINDVTAAEGTDAVLTVKLSAKSEKTVTVDWATVGGGDWGKAQPGVDFTAATGSLEFKPGETEKTIKVSILKDNTKEDAEQFLVRLSNEKNATIASGDRAGIVTIPGNDT